MSSTVLMALRVFAPVLVLSPLALSPAVLLKGPLWSHASGMCGVALALLLAFCLSALTYTSERFSAQLLLYRGAVHRRSLLRVVCSPESNALMWVLATVFGYCAGLNVGVAVAAQSLPFRPWLAFTVNAAVTAVIEACLVVALCYAPMLRFMGLEDVKRFSPVESLACAVAIIVVAELLGVAFATYAAVVVALAELAKDTLFQYLLGIYGGVILLMGVVVTARAAYLFLCGRNHQALISA